MNIKEYNYDNYNVYLIKTKKFKTTKIRTLFIKDYKYSDKTKAKLLSNVLCRTSKNYNTEIEVSKQIMNLYNPYFSIGSSYNNVQITEFNISFLDEKYTEKGMMKKTIDYYYDTIFKPNVVDNKFESKSFMLSKKILESFYKRQKEKPSLYAWKESVKLISDDVTIKYPSYGCLEELNEINEENLYEYYKELITKSSVSIFVIGDFNDEEMLSYIEENLKDKSFLNKKYNINASKLNKVKKETEKIEKGEYNQSNLLMLYKIIDPFDYERKYVLPVLNRILGLPFTSKLFINVREKNSMAYSVYSSYASLSSILYIEAGISSENYDKVLSLCKKQIKDIQEGNITDKELKVGIENFITSLQRTKDSQNGMINIAIDNIIFDIDIEEEKIKNVTKEEVINLAKKLDLDVVYLLKGEKLDENNKS